MDEVYAAQSVGASYCAACGARIPAGIVMLCHGAKEYCPACARWKFEPVTIAHAVAALLKQTREKSRPPARSCFKCDAPEGTPVPETGPCCIGHLWYDFNKPGN